MVDAETLLTLSRSSRAPFSYIFVLRRRWESARGREKEMNSSQTLSDMHTPFFAFRPKSFRNGSLAPVSGARQSYTGSSSFFFPFSFAFLVVVVSSRAQLCPLPTRSFRIKLVKSLPPPSFFRGVAMTTKLINVTQSRGKKKKFVSLLPLYIARIIFKMGRINQVL